MGATFHIKQRGFTLVELVMTIVLLGIISAVLAPVITSNVTAFSDTRSRNELVARGRIALERLSREIHQAVPNSLRLVTGRTDTIEFVTVKAGGRYVDRIDPQITSTSCPTAQRFRTGVTRLQLCLFNPANPAPFSNGDILVIGNTSPTTLQNGASRVALTGVVLGASPLWQVTFTATHTFNNASPGKHYSIVEGTHEVGLANDGALHWAFSSGVTAMYNDGVNVTSGDPLLVDGVDTVTFGYNAAADGMLNINLTLRDGTETVQLHEEIYVRNTP